MSYRLKITVCTLLWLGLFIYHNTFRLIHVVTLTSLKIYIINLGWVSCFFLYTLSGKMEDCLAIRHWYSFLVCPVKQWCIYLHLSMGYWTVFSSVHAILYHIQPFSYL
jgi:hypothetical protein